jgi:hypothetical protein
MLAVMFLDIARSYYPPHKTALSCGVRDAFYYILFSRRLFGRNKLPAGKGDRGTG